LLRLPSVLSFSLWVTDITYLPTWAGFLSLAIVLDALEPARDRLGHGTASRDRALSWPPWTWPWRSVDPPTTFNTGMFRPTQAHIAKLQDFPVGQGMELIVGLSPGSQVDASAEVVLLKDHRGTSAFIAT